MAAIKLYTTGTCPYCHRAKALLALRGVTQMEEIRVDLQPERRAEMTAASGRTTVPQIFINGQHVGGCDDLHALDARGGLVPLLGA
jgi:glutaredoxin 3